jgi:hypothetical protein
VSSRISIGALVALVGLGALLRLDAFTGHYGTLEHPAWARVATRDIAPAARRVRPGSVAWAPIADPYVGGDPINYLKFAREMRTFYQPHVREPVFLAVTRIALALLDDQDAAVSLASAAGSLLLIVGAYLLGAELISPLAGLASAAVMAIDYDLVTWAPDGWRDDMFSATVALAAWAFVRFRRHPSFGNALLVGFTSGAACLTRITAVSFALPALLWVSAAGPGAVRPRLEYAAVALVVLAAIVGPFLLSCAIATGDPLYAIDYHTVYYRAADGLSVSTPMSAGEYLWGKFAAHPLGTLDAGITGEFVRPFTIKWNGLRIWAAWLPAATAAAALLGLLMLPFTADGRLLLLMLLGSLLPYVFTWNIAAGGEWRFTMHAYPFYVVAACFAVAGVARLIRALVTQPASWRARAMWLGVRAGIVCALVAAAVVVYVGVLPWFVASEAIGKGDSVSIGTGGRDRAFYRSGWSRAHSEGIVTVRVSIAPRAAVSIPLPVRRAYDLVLRLDPAAPADGQSMTVLFNQQIVLSTTLDWNAQRVGAYRLHVPIEWMRTGRNDLVIVPTPTVAAATADSRFSWLRPDQRLGVRIWMVRVIPLT